MDAATGDLVPRSHVVLAHARRTLGHAVATELNLCQIETGTPVCTTLTEVRTELTRLRSELGAAAGEASCGVAAVGTHPFGVWQDQQVDVSRERYRRMEEAYQIVARQQVICGCHVHVGIPDPELAIATMNRSRPWLPILLALSANSTFWQAVDSGYASYRLQVWQRWPTLGMPPHLSSMKDFQMLIEELKSIEALEDPTFIYWYVRPSVRFPTLEFRACDVCATVDDAVVLAGLIRALAWSCGQDVLNARPHEQRRREVLEAAMWRAARYGLEGTLVSPSAMMPRPAAETVAEFLTYVRAGLEAHGDWLEVSEGVSEILRRGNGASHQRRVFARRQNTHDVITWALSATLPGSAD